MRKVLMTADAIGGVWQYSLELADGFKDRDIYILLAVIGGGIDSTKRDELSGLTNVQFVENPCKLEWMEEPWQDVAASGEWLLALAEDFRPDIVHLNGYSHASLPWNAPVVVVAHSCVLSWFAAVRGEAALSEWDQYRKSVRRGLRGADLVIAPSQFMLQEVEFHYGPLHNARVILNGRSRNSFHTGQKENIILCAGRIWDDAKNLRVLSEAATGVEWPVFAAGECGVDLLSDLNLLGKLDSATLADWYSRASIYASPALYEPFGLTVLEAALSGCALVLSDIPSFREIWGNAAVYLDPRDATAWRYQLNLLVSDPVSRAKLASAALTRGRELTASKMTAQYLQAYEQAQINRQCVSLSSATPSDPTGIMEMPIFSAA